MYEAFRDIGRDCFLSGLVGSHSGNLSVRLGDRLLISRRAAMLGSLLPPDLVETGIDRDDAATPSASSELVTHRAIYRLTGAEAVLHTHPPHAIVLSFAHEAFVPVDLEGRCLFERVPVVATEKVGAGEAAEPVAAALVEHRLCLLRGHGLFARGSSLEEAYQLSSSLESSARVAYLARVAGIEPR